MSRVGKKPIPIPSGVPVTSAHGEVTVKGPKGQMSLRTLPGIQIKVAGSTLTIEQNSTARTAGAFHGLTRALINNQVLGVSEGFKKVLEIVGTGFGWT